MGDMSDALNSDIKKRQRMIELNKGQQNQNVHQQPRNPQNQSQRHSGPSNMSNNTIVRRS